MLFANSQDPKALDSRYCIWPSASSKVYFLTQISLELLNSYLAICI